MGLIASRLTLEGPVQKNKSSFIVSGRRTYISELAQPFIKEDAPIKGSGYYFYDFNAKINAKYYWVCLRHEIDYLGEAFLGDEITVITWVGESKGVKSKRHVAIVKDQTLIAKAETLWCLIDSKTQKPARINSEILDLLST